MRALALLIALGLTQISGALASAPLDYRPDPSAAPQPLPTAGLPTPEAVEAFFDGFFASRMKTGPVAGATVAVVKDGALFFAKGYGFENVEKQVPVDAAQTLFRPGSVSKLFTWTAVMQLVEQGKLNLDQDVNTYLKDITIPATYEQPITLRNIMTHTTGFEDGGIGYLFSNSEKDIIPLKEWLLRHMPERVRPPTTDFATGTNASYSNYATALAGYIVECVSGQSFDDYIDQHIFGPLGMTRTTFREPLPPELAKRMSVGYAYENGAFVGKPFELIHSVGPAGSVSATATDMAKFMLAYLQGGGTEGVRILKPETVELMHTRTMSPDPNLAGAALGFYETWINGRRIVGHGGDTLYFHSVLSLLPEANVGLFASVNTGGEGALTSVELEKAFFRYFFPAKLPVLKPPADASERNERYAGSYRTLRRSFSAWEKAFALGADEKVVAMPDGSLLMPFMGKPARWVEVRDGVFRSVSDDLYIAFKGDDGGIATNLVGPFAPISAARLSWYETSTFHIVLAGISLLLFITILVSAIRQRRADRSGPANVRWARPALALAGVLLIMFVVLLAIILSAGLDALIFKVPPSLYVALVFPLLALLPAAAAVYFLVTAWRTRAWRLGARIHYTVATVAVLAFLWMLNYWNLLGYHFG